MGYFYFAFDISGGPHTDVVRHVRIGECDVSQNVLRQNQSFNIELVDNAPADVMVQADGVHAGTRYRGLDQLVVDAIEIISPSKPLRSILRPNGMVTKQMGFILGSAIHNS